MNIEEYKKFANNKINADAVTQKVRDVIKVTKWEKQDIKEGFKETFKPLLKSQDSIKKSIDEQQNKVISQLKKNQLAISQGFEPINNLDGMRELPFYKDDDYDYPFGIYDNEPGWNKNFNPAETPSSSREEGFLNLEKNFDGWDLNFLRSLNYPRPNDFFEINPKELEKIKEELNNDIKQISGEISGRKNKKDPSVDYMIETENLKNEKGVLLKYKNTMKDYLRSLKYKMGEGMVYYNNPQQLLKRLELLGGSILAGNNGVIPEFSQIAHLLNQMKIITKKQLNNLIKNYVTNK